MDWSKAKSILIIAFIITNLILGYVLVENKDIDETFNKEFIEDVKAKLLEKNINVIAEIPLDAPSLPKLTVEYEVYNPQELAMIFLGKYDEKDEKDNKKIFKSGDKTLHVLDNNRKLLYRFNNSEEKYNNLSESKLKLIVEDFLKNKGFRTDDFKLGDYDYDPMTKTHYLEYVKRYNGRFVEETYMRFNINNTGVIEFERYWLETKEITDSNFSISSAPNVLLRLISKIDVIGKTITDIDLCYYFSVNYDYEYVNPKNAMKGQAIPAWRIKFSDGTKKFFF